MTLSGIRSNNEGSCGPRKNMRLQGDGGVLPIYGIPINRALELPCVRVFRCDWIAKKTSLPFKDGRTLRNSPT